MTAEQSNKSPFLEETHSAFNFPPPQSKIEPHNLSVRMDDDSRDQDSKPLYVQLLCTISVDN